MQINIISLYTYVPDFFLVFWIEIIGAITYHVNDSSADWLGLGPLSKYTNMLFWVKEVIATEVLVHCDNLPSLLRKLGRYSTAPGLRHKSNIHLKVRGLKRMKSFEFL